MEHSLSTAALHVQHNMVMQQPLVLQDSVHLVLQLFCA
jgi:hypothetical protein